MEAVLKGLSRDIIFSNCQSNKFQFQCMSDAAWLHILRCSPFGNTHCDSSGVGFSHTRKRVVAALAGPFPVHPAATHCKPQCAAAGGTADPGAFIQLVDKVKGEIYIAFNAGHLPVNVSLPERPGYRWEPLVDTSRPSPFDFMSSDVPHGDIAVCSLS